MTHGTEPVCQQQRPSLGVSRLNNEGPPDFQWHLSKENVLVQGWLDGAQPVHFPRLLLSCFDVYTRRGSAIWKWLKIFATYSLWLRHRLRSRRAWKICRPNDCSVQSYLSFQSHVKCVIPPNWLHLCHYLSRTGDNLRSQDYDVSITFSHNIDAHVFWTTDKS